MQNKAEIKFEMIQRINHEIFNGLISVIVIIFISVLLFHSKISPSLYLRLSLTLLIIGTIAVIFYFFTDRWKSLGYMIIQIEAIIVVYNSGENVILNKNNISQITLKSWDNSNNPKMLTFEDCTYNYLTIKTKEKKYHFRLFIENYEKVKKVNFFLTTYWSENNLVFENLD
jgi:hypothetical protein